MLILLVLAIITVLPQIIRLLNMEFFRGFGNMEVY